MVVIWVLCWKARILAVLRHPSLAASTSMQLFYDADIDPKLIRTRRVAVLGFGAQGKAQAANLKDSGVDVRVGLRAGSASRAAASAAGLQALGPAEAAAWADVVVMLIPDETQPQIYREALEPKLKQGATLIFAHGYNIHFKRILPRPDLDVVMVAPNGIGDQVRIQYQAGHGVPGLVAVQQDVSGQARALAFSYGGALGLGRRVPHVLGQRQQRRQDDHGQDCRRRCGLHRRRGLRVR